MTKPSSPAPKPPASADASTTAASTPEPTANPLGKREEAAKIPPKSKGASEKNRIDTFFKTRAYRIIFIFGVIGMIVLPVLAVLSLLSEDTLETFGISRKWNISEFAQSIYYIFLFLGAVLAATLATWRGRQSEEQIRQSDKQIDQFERQLKNSRFEKAIEMATDPKSRARRASGFRILEQMLSTWGENFDDATEKNIRILDYLVFNSFKKTLKQKKTFNKLYNNSKTSYGTGEKISSGKLFEQTHKLDINGPALNLWIGIVDWNRRKWSDPAVTGIYAPKVISTGSHHFIFSGMNLENLQFLVMSDEGEIVPSTQSAMVDFKRSCFLAIEMHGTTVDYVDFSTSHFFKINREEKNKENCNMSCVGAIFKGANLIDCNFRGANFKGASFVGITTLSTIFDKANLTDCNFEGADLGGASFVETNISGSDFSQAKNLTKEQFQKNAYWIRPTRPQFPEGWGEDFVYSLSRRAQD